MLTINIWIRSAPCHIIPTVHIILICTPANHFHYWMPVRCTRGEGSVYFESWVYLYFCECRKYHFELVSCREGITITMLALRHTSAQTELWVSFYEHSVNFCIGLGGRCHNSPWMLLLCPCCGSVQTKKTIASILNGEHNSPHSQHSVMNSDMVCNVNVFML